MSSDTVYMLIAIGLGGIVCLGALAVFGLGAYFLIIRPGINRSNVVNRNWEAFARNKGLTFVKGVRPGISGVYQGRQVKLVVINPIYDFDGPVKVTGRTTSSKYLMTRISAAGKDDNLELKVYTRGLFDQAVSEQNPGIGNAAFDAKYQVTCNPPDRAKSILKPEVQSALLERQVNLLDFHNGTLNLNAIGVESRPEILEAFLELTCRIADEVEKSATTPAS
jgi:hypothetical protein